MRYRPRSVRRGATLVEGAVVLLAFLIFVFGLLDLSLALLRTNLLSEASRRGARQAIIHGQMAPTGWNGGPWGPTTINVSANTSGIPIVDEIQPLLVGMDLSKTTIKVEWIDGGNAVGQRVRATISGSYQPMITFIFGKPSIPLSASSTMPIAH
jgi:hypothetical protein